MLDHTNEKYDEKHRDVMDKLSEISQLQQESLKESKFTNGKVAAAMIDIEALKTYNSTRSKNFKWFVGISIPVGLAILSFLAWIIQQDIRQTTQDAVQASLSEFNIIVK